MAIFWGFSLFSLLIILAAVFGQENTYDYIVVGSGPGGGTVAVNLAKSGASVLLLEAGDDQGDKLSEQVAAWSFLTLGEPLMRWDFFVKYHTDDNITSKFKHLTWETADGQHYVGTDPPAGAKQLGVYYPRAGTLGGCSSTDALIAVLPSDSDWQQIVDITGDESWSPEKMRQHFINLENARSIPKGTPGHGWDGFLDITLNGVENMQNQSQLLEVMAAAAKVSGQDPTKILEYTQLDANALQPDRDQQVGVSGLPGHRDPTGRRVSSRDAVVDTLHATNPDGSKKYNLTISFNSFATRVLLETRHRESYYGRSFKPKAIGVEYLLGQSMYAADPRYNASAEGETIQAFANKEVIVSGGAFNSPQLLKLSGIGPKAELEKFNIPIVVDLPGVGANLQDNPEIGFFANAAINFTSTVSDCTFGMTPDDPCLPEWVEAEGPYTQGPGNGITLKTSRAQERDVFLSLLAAPGFTFRGYYPFDAINPIPRDAPNTVDFSMLRVHRTGKEGTVNLVSNNPRDVPDINFRLFENEGADDDLEALKEGVEYSRKVVNSISPPLGPFQEIWPCPGDEECDLKEVIKTQAWSHHATSTCMIGANDDPLAVLDSKFRVRGVEGLRVVDASAFPRPPGPFPILPTFMLGMKATEAILEDYEQFVY